MVMVDFVGEGALIDWEYDDVLGRGSLESRGMAEGRGVKVTASSMIVEDVEMIRWMIRIQSRYR